MASVDVVNQAGGLAPVFVLDPRGTLFADALRRRLPGRPVLDAAPRSGDCPYLVTATPPPGVIKGLRGLKLVLSLNAGVERILHQGEIPPEVRLVKMADVGLRTSMTEWVLANVLAWHRHLWTYADQQAERSWRQLDERLACERRATVLGAGALGVPVGAALQRLGFDVRLFGRRAGRRRSMEVFAGRGGLAAAVAGADVLINLLPLTADTRGLVDREVLEGLSPGALFVNGGRGATVNDLDLLAALDGGRLSLAALDVFEVEPLPTDHPFWGHPRIRLTPHVAAITRPDTAADAIAATIDAFEAGRPLRHVVKPPRGY